MEKKYVINTRQTFKIASIVNKSGKFNEIAKIIEKSNSNTEMGVNLTSLLIDILVSQEEEIYEILSDVSGISPEEIAEQPVYETLEMIESIFKEPGLMKFLGKFKS